MAGADLDRLLRFAPLAEAEQATGKSYKEDPDTMGLGFRMMLSHSGNKDRALQEANDSWFNMTFADQVALFKDMGFKAVLRESFTGTRYSDGEPEVEETYLILWHPDGILATCESYGRDRRNSAKVYYNFRGDDGRPDWSLTSSGHMTEDGVWVGDHDAREGIRHKLAALGGAGEFLPVWVERPFLWLLNYSEKNTDDYAEINGRKIALLPEHVRSAITPTP